MKYPRHLNPLLAIEACYGPEKRLQTISTALGARVGILEDIVVSDAVRGSGIGSQLLKQALIFAKEKGCQRITLLTDHDNTLAHTFYQKHGFDLSTMVVFRQSLDF